MRVGVFCRTCNLWIHQRCEGLSNAELKDLSKNPINDLVFVCCVCKEKQSVSITETSLPLNEQIEPTQGTSASILSNEPTLDEGGQIFQLSDPASSQTENTPFPFNETSLPESEQSFQFEAENLKNISL